MDHDLRVRVARLSLEDKVRLLTGRTSWALHAAPEAGLLPMTVSDGPAGVRGGERTEADHSASLPSPTGIGAAWDEELMERVGRFFAAEARRQGVDAVLAPLVNLQRSPAGGRHFECFSEDPLLTGRMGAAFVRALQSEGVGACVKHFIGNETEYRRTSYVSRIDERTLREVYLPPFEDTVVQAGAWMVMAAYNGADDGTGAAPMTAHRRLLSGILKGELGFDGVVVSDWSATTTTAASAAAGLDLVMPGPLGPWRGALVAAVRSGEVAEPEIDDKVLRLLRLARRVGKLDTNTNTNTNTNTATAAEPAGEDETVLLREAGARGHVLLRNEGGLLPLARAALRRVALIGPNAVEPRTQGGGSAHVSAKRLVAPAEGLRAALPAGVELTVHRGGDTRRLLPDADGDRLGGVRIEIRDAEGALLAAPEADGAGVQVPVHDPRAADARVTARLYLAEPGRHRIGVGAMGRYEAAVDGRPIGAGTEDTSAEDILTSRHSNPEGPVTEVVVGTAPREVEVELRTDVADFGDFGRSVLARIRHLPPGPAAEEEIAAAVEAARAADAAVVVVGTNDEVESEGYDRPALDLPGRQDELVRRVLAANPRTVAVVNAGAPVLLPWLEEAPAVLWTWFGGQEYGHALADVLTGAAEPTGRLPWTLPARHGDVPMLSTRPVQGVHDYAEGVFVGHRAYDRPGAPAPAREFGFGLGYTTWEVRGAELAAPPRLAGGTVADPLHLDVAVANTGERPGRHVVQVYVEPPESGGALPRPVRSLAGFACVHAHPGEEVRATVAIRPRAFAVWDESAGGWRVPEGRYSLAVGSSSRTLHMRIPVELGRN